MNLLYSLPEDLKHIIVPMVQIENLRTILNSTEFNEKVAKYKYYEISSSVKHGRFIYTDSYTAERANIRERRFTYENINNCFKLRRIFKPSLYDYRISNYTV